MKNYVLNCWAWLRGIPWLWTRRNDYRHEDGTPIFSVRIGQAIQYKDGWGPWSYLPVYLIDVGACVIFLAGAVEPISTFAQRHRTGTVWDKILDVIERFDPGHGANSGSALWGTTESPKAVRILIPCVWALVALWAFV